MGGLSMERDEQEGAEPTGPGEEAPVPGRTVPTPMARSRARAGGGSKTRSKGAPFQILARLGLSLPQSLKLQNLEWAPWVVVAVGGWAVFTLVAGGLPRLAAETSVFNVAGTVRDLNRGEVEDSRQALVRAIQGRQALSDLLPAHQVEEGIWLTGLADSLSEARSAQSRRTMRRAQDVLRRGLAGAPMNGRGWAFYAHGCASGGRPTARCREALRLSFMLGPYKTNYIRWRLNAALAMAQRLDKDLTARVERQVSYIWDVERLRPLLVDLDATQPGRAWIAGAFAGRPEVPRRIRFARVRQRMLEERNAASQ